MSSTATATITYRKTKNGEWVAYGPADLLTTGTITVTKKNGTTKNETVARLGRPFNVGGTRMVYGYLDKTAGYSTPAPVARRRTRRSACPTGGNCSSFGSGKSCGAWDCDGWD